MEEKEVKEEIEEIKMKEEKEEKEENLLDSDDLCKEMAKLKVELKGELYKDEKEELLKERKNQLLERLYKLSNNLKSKKNIQEFLEDKKNYVSDTFQFADGIKEYSEKVLCFQIKVLGPLFFICFLAVLFQIMGYSTTLKEEVIYAIKIFYNPNTTDIGDDFYSRLKFKEENTIPDFNLFFISSLFSGLLLGVFNFPILTILDLIIIGLIFIFGINTFNFVENKKYSFAQFLQLILYFIGIDFLLGLIALLPLQLLMNGYFVYEKWIQEKKNLNKNEINDELNNKNNKNKENLIISPVGEKENNIINTREEKESLINYKISTEDSFDNINISKEEINEPKNKDQVFYSFNGLVFTYFISFIISLFIRDYINTEISEDIRTIIYIGLVVFTLILYLFFSLALTKKKMISQKLIFQ